MMATDTQTIDLDAEIIDVRDVIARVEHLEGLGTAGPVDLGDDNYTDQDTLFAELHDLRMLLDDLKGNGGDEQWRGDWYPLSLISDYYFEDYARELADDIGAVDANASWPNSFIDWERAAAALQMDYTAIEIEVDGIERRFWTR